MVEIVIYMVNQGTLQKIDKAIFSTGDAYVVVDKAAQKVYVWLGSKCSVDEKGTGAIEARRIDDQEFSGNAKIITYDEGMEDKEFLVKLQGLRIVEKNLAKTMLKDVKTGEFAGQQDWVDVLYRVSSEEFENMSAMKFVQVPFKKESLDSEDCFIADLGTDLFIWQGKSSNIKEKAMALKFARDFDADRAGRQTPKVFVEGEDDKEFLDVFLGIKPKQDRETIDLKAEAFEEGPKKEEAAPAPEPVKKEEPKPAAPAPAPVKKEEPKPAAPAPVKKEEPKPAAPAPAPAVEGKPKMVEMKDKHEVLIIKGTRLVCPKCGNPNKNMMREVEDRAHQINDYPVMFGHKWVCGKCNTHFRKED